MSLQPGARLPLQLSQLLQRARLAQQFPHAAGCAADGWSFPQRPQQLLLSQPSGRIERVLSPGRLVVRDLDPEAVTGQCEIAHVPAFHQTMSLRHSASATGAIQTLFGRHEVLRAGCCIILYRQIFQMRPFMTALLRQCLHHQATVACPAWEYIAD